MPQKRHFVTKCQVKLPVGRTLALSLGGHRVALVGREEGGQQSILIPESSNDFGGSWAQSPWLGQTKEHRSINTGMHLSTWGFSDGVVAFIVICYQVCHAQ